MDSMGVYQRRIKPRVNFDGPVPPDPWREVEGGCWLWTGGCFPAGYGSISVDDETYLVHRIVYEALNGPIPEGLFIDHVCRVRTCIRHLEAVTPAENMGRAQRSHCKHGHAFTMANTHVIAGTNQRVCRACGRAKTARYELKLRSAERAR